MKNMVLLIDANVLLNYLLNRGVECDYAMTVINFCRKGKVRGYMAFHTVSILWYALRKKPVQERRELLLDLCKIITRKKMSPTSAGGGGEYHNRR
jgi:predicted nucleic acid-binding protein